MAGRFLKEAVVSAEAVVDLVNEVKRELTITMFATGAANLEELSKIPLIKDV